ncbi:MAG: uroporphyrinogen-III synthase [Agromyces sp.]
MAESLRGLRVLVPRAGAWGERVRAEIENRGGVPIIAPLIEAQPPKHTAELDRLLAEIQAGTVEWMFITSASTVEQLASRGVRIPATTQIAAVGRATARALIEAGMHVDFLPAGQSSALEMVRQWCAKFPPGTVGSSVVLRGDLAMASVSDELEVQGHTVEVGIMYRTVGVDLAPDVRSALERGEIDAVLLTAGSVARELHQQVPTLADHIVRVAIGPATTHAAEKLGLRVDLTAREQTIEAMLDALATIRSEERSE